MGGTKADVKPVRGETVARVIALLVSLGDTEAADLLVSSKVDSMCWPSWFDDFAQRRVETMLTIRVMRPASSPEKSRAPEEIEERIRNAFDIEGIWCDQVVVIVEE